MIRMQHIWLAALCVAGLALLGCGAETAVTPTAIPSTPTPTAVPATPTPTPTTTPETAVLPDGFVSFTDATLGLRFAHPAAWLVLPDAGAVYLASSETVVVGDSFADGAAVFLFVLPAEEEAAALSATERLTEFVGRFSLLTEPEAAGAPQRRTINGQAAAQVIYNGGYAGADVVAVYTVVVAETNAVVVVTLTAQPETFGEDLTAVTQSVELFAPEASAAPTVNSAEFNTRFPLVGQVSNFEGGGGDNPINYQSNVSLADVLTFYRTTLTEQGFTERPQSTVVTDEAINLVFDGATIGRVLVVQGVALGPQLTNVNIRYAADG